VKNHLIVPPTNITSMALYPASQPTKTQPTVEVRSTDPTLPATAIPATITKHNPYTAVLTLPRVKFMALSSISTSSVPRPEKMQPHLNATIRNFQ
jgi:hypothetical protein